MEIIEEFEILYSLLSNYTKQNCIFMAWCKIVVSPMLMHWLYRSSSSKFIFQHCTIKNHKIQIYIIICTHCMNDTRWYIVDGSQWSWSSSSWQPSCFKPPLEDCGKTVVSPLHKYWWYHSFAHYFEIICSIYPYACRYCKPLNPHR